MYFESQTVLNAFFLFDVLVMESYDFHSIVCGYHPWALVMDITANEVADSEDNCEIDSDPDVVDCESFWETVELS